MKTAFQFATVELLPYAALGEFVIVGVLLMTDRRELTTRLLPAKSTTRLTRFFPEIDRAVFTETLRSINIELETLEMNLTQGHIGTLPLDLEGGDEQTIFRTLTAPREGLIRIRARGTAIAEDIGAWIDQAYDRFVLRTADGISDPAERTLTEHIGSLLREWHVARLYRPAIIGETHLYVRFPFAHTPEGFDRPTRAIKPLHLAHDSPTKILEHGDAWLQKIRRLRQFGPRLDRIIVPIKPPPNTGPQLEERRDVVDCLIADLRREDVEVIDESDHEKLRTAVKVEFSGFDGRMVANALT